MKTRLRRGALKTGKVILVTSGKGGTGKTTTVGATAACLAVLGYRTLCIDCDAGLRNLDITLGMSDYTVSDLSDVLSGNVPLEDGCAEHPQIPGLFFLTAPLNVDSMFSGMGSMKTLLAESRKHFDFCFLDSPAGIGSGFRLAACDADTAIIVTTPDMSCIRNAQRAAEEIRALSSSTDIRLLVNRVKKSSFRRTDMTIDDIIDSAAAQLIGVISEDSSVQRAANKETPLILDTAHGAAKQFLNVARRLSGESVPLDISR